MYALYTLIVLASTSGSAGQIAKNIVPPKSPQVIQEQPKGPNGLTLYNSNGEIVARCGKKEDSFADCKMEPGVTLDDLMNAWVHAYQTLQK